MDNVGLDEQERRYMTPYGVLPRISTILNGSKPESQGDGEGWKQYVPNAENYLRDAIDRGNALHAYMEARLMGQAPDIDYLEFVAPELITQAEDLIDNYIVKVLGVEEVCYHSSLYAGTRDLKAILKLDDEEVLSVLDYKTRPPKPENSRMSRHIYKKDNRLQVAAYSKADEEMTGDVSEPVLAHFVMGHDRVLFTRLGKDKEKYWDGFQARLQLYFERNDF